MTLDLATTASRMARDAVREWLHEWDCEEIVDTVLLIVSELVTNATRYAGTSFEVSLSADWSGIEVAVRDGDRRGPNRPEEHASGAASLTEHGRGLMIVEGLADQWGVTELLDGKQVWARITPPAEWSHRHVCPV